MYDIDGLKHGIEQAKKHIQVLEGAIDKEKNTIKEYKIMINDLEKKKLLAENNEISIDANQESEN